MLEIASDWLIFVKVVQGGSFTAGADALSLPKTTVSRRIRELELRLGMQLLQRTTRRLGLTEAGAVYFQHCEPLAQSLANAEAAVHQLTGTPRGLLRVTAPYSLMVNLLAPLLGEFRQLYPAVTIDAALSHQVEELVAGEIDVALRLGPLPDSSLAARHLAKLPNHIFASSAYLERYGTPIHPKELIGHMALATRVAAFNDGFAWPLTCGTPLVNYPIQPVIVADDPEVLKAPLFAGAGLMLATDLIMQKHVQQGQVQMILPEWSGRSPELNAVFPRSRILPLKLRVFIDFLVDRLPQFISA